MNKCFEGIQKLHFEEDLKITGMYSSLGEYIVFDSQIDPIHYKTEQEMENEKKEIAQQRYQEGNLTEDPIIVKPTAVRNVESWLSEVETQM